MKTKTHLISILLVLAATLAGQSNTAVTSGSIGKCSVWGHPYTLYNSTAGSMNVGAGISITVDQNRSIAAVNLSGTGVMDLSGANGITLSGSSGDMHCRWDINRTDAHTLINNDGQRLADHYQDWGTFFTAPYSGTYRWQRNTGWQANMPPSSSLYTAGIFLFRNGNFYGTRQNIFLVDQGNICGGSGGFPNTWTDTFTWSLSAGNILGYAAQTAWGSGAPCNETQLNAVCGNATLFFDN